MKLRIKTGDEVKIIAGKEKGRKGPVLEVNFMKRKIRVKGVRVQTLFDKKEGILKKEGFIDYSNVSLLQAASKQVKKSSKAKKLVQAKKPAAKASKKPAEKTASDTKEKKKLFSK